MNKVDFFDAVEGDNNSVNVREDVVEWIVNEVKKLKLLPVGITHTQNQIIQKIASKHSMAFLNSARTRPPTTTTTTSGKGFNDDVILNNTARHQIIQPKSDKLITRNMSSNAILNKGEEKDAGPNTVHAPLVVRSSVRSGHQVYSSGADLVVMGNVHSGAEVLADGNIHIYGSLKGRALAGLSGDTTASIFANKFDAELVSKRSDRIS